MGGGTAFLIGSLVLASMLPFEFIPAEDVSRSNITIQLPPGSTLAETDSVVQRVNTALLERPEVGGSTVGTTGYCMGGRLALLAAATRPDAVAAIGMFHTGGLVTDEPDSPHRQLPRVRADVLAIHADHDHSLPPEAVAEFEHALTSCGVSHSAWVHEGAHHGFTMADTAVYHPAAAEEHFERLRDLFNRTLR